MHHFAQLGYLVIPCFSFDLSQFIWFSFLDYKLTENVIQCNEAANETIYSLQSAQMN